jgi:type VI secretion system secreted protein VgrG
MRAILENRKLRMKGPLPETKMFIKAARVKEGLSQISEIQVDFMSPDRMLKLGDIVGQSITVRIQIGEDGGGASGSTGGGGTGGGGSGGGGSGGDGGGSGGGTWREHMGTCIAAQYIGMHEGYGFYALEVRPWLWFLTRTTGCRIFQNKTAIDIIKQIFSERGFADYTVNASRTPEPRVYCVQYNETDFDFISRLMEEEGFYYYSTVKNGKDHLMVVDGIGGHSAIAGNSTVQFHLREPEYRRSDDHIFEWRGMETAPSGKVTIRDYNFEKPRADMTTVKATPKGSHSHKDYELYRYPGHYRETALGEIYARIRMEAAAWPFQTRDGVCNVRTMATGATYRMSNHERSDENQEYLVVSALHMMQIENQEEDESQQMTKASGAAQLPGTIEFDEDNRDAYRCTMRSLPKNVPFRAPHRTPWPRIPGILLAKVTGPAGEEIYTDNYGRIKVQFPWDREGKNDENTTCWVRYCTPWSGKDWGAIAIPRIGQEVVIQFEDGDIDRPICTGMLYNADTMPPYALPANMTQTGIKTRSSKGGGADNYNELVFEDKKDAEFIRMHAEKDYFLTVENNAVVSIGRTKKDPGDLTTDIHNSRTETIHEGDLTLTVAKGNETRDIKTDRTEKIGQHATQEVGGNKTMKVTGNFSGETGGNSETKVTGNAKTEVTGTTDHKSTGAMTIESSASITIKVGGNSITIDPSGITIKGTMVTTDASGMATHKSGGIMTIQGSLVNIN